MVDIKKLIDLSGEEYEGERRDKLRKSLYGIINGELSQKEKEYFCLYIFEERSINEIALMKNVNKSTVSRAIKNAVRKIRKILFYAKV